MKDTQSDQFSYARYAKSLATVPILAVLLSACTLTMARALSKVALAILAGISGDFATF